MHLQSFYQGTEFYAQDWLGAHIVEGGVVFRTFAPAAEGIVVVTDAGEWPMHKIEDGNFWEAYAAGLTAGTHYLYRIYHAGSCCDHADPYAFASELRPQWRSIVCDLSFDWHDQAWMEKRSQGADISYGQPLNIYEMHLGSWRKRSGDVSSDNPADWYSYSELADMLPAYLEESGYNCVEFMPLTEYPFDGSWGYQPTGFYSPTSRYGRPDQLMELVDGLHARNIRVILDFVPVHFATDSWALANYDGTALFEYPNDTIGVSEWGSCNFMHSRGETCSFLQSAANFWCGAYHFDGLRIDALSRIIYWQGDQARGENKNALDFIRRLSSGVKSLNPGAIMIAEDSTDYDGTTRPSVQGGLSFDYKWDMGWMHDTLDFFQTGPAWRTDNYHKLSFSMMYFGNERYLLPLSHDENVHGKATVLQKMEGLYEGKFAQGKALYLYMMSHPGKKLNFMGGEIGQLREWDENREQDWFLRTYPLHDAFYRFCRELNHLYLEHSALWEQDYAPEGFRWLQVADELGVVYAFERTSSSEKLICVLNLSDHVYDHYGLALEQTQARVLIDTSWQRYAGDVPDAPQQLLTYENGQLMLSLPPMSGKLLLAE